MDPGGKLLILLSILGVLVLVLLALFCYFIYFYFFRRKYLKRVNDQRPFLSLTMSDYSIYSFKRGDSIGAGGYGIVDVERNRETGDKRAVKELKNIENEESIRKEQEVEQYISGTQREICDPPIGDGGSASVHVASNRVTRDLNAVKKEDAAAANSISESTSFSKWEKGERIGAGGFGTVYVAHNRETGALCAVKELKDIDKPESVQKEIKILSQLEHPNIVKYYAHEIDGNKISVYMEFIKPGSLKKYISKRGGALHETLIQKFTAQILAGLVYLQSKRVVHRDLKPDNILVDSQDIVKLVDFGVSKHLAESVGKHSMLGTPYYAAPEVLKQKPYKSSSEAYAGDIWSLGCIIIEMFSGKHPWPRCKEPVQVIFQVCVKKQCPPIPNGFCSDGKNFLECCFIRNPADRASAAELQDHPFVKPQNLSC